MTTISFGSTNAIAGTYRIYRKNTWGDSWTLDETLVLESVSWTANPTIPAASFSYHYGPAIERTAATQTLRAKKDLAGAWIRIEVDCPDGIRHWCGYVDSQADLENGFVTSGSTTAATGRQSFQCVGVIQALAYSRLEKSFVNRQPPTGDETVAICISPPRFNEIIGDEARPRKTRETTKLSGQNSFLHIFNYALGRSSRTEYKTWSTRDICEHIIDRYKPHNSDDEEEIIFEWKSGALDKLPTNDTPFLDCTDLTVLDSLNVLLSNATMYGYTADLDVGTGKVVLDVFTFAASEVVLGDFTVPANATKFDLAMIGDPGTTYTIQKNTSSFYHQVVALGARRQVIFTTSNDARITDQYTTAFDAELTGRIASRVAAISGDASLSFNEKAVRIAATYDSPEFKDLRVLYAPRSSWNYQIGSEKLFEDQESEAYFPNPQNCRVLEHLPLPASQDYSTSLTLGVIGSASTVMMDNQVFSKKVEVDSNGDITFHATDLMFWGNRSKQNYYDTAASPPFTIEASPAQGLPLGFRYILSGASSYHIKTGVMTAYPEFSPHLPAFNMNDFKATICLEEDRELEKVWPATPPTGKDAIRKLYIRNHRLRKIRIMKDTLLFTNNTTYKVTATTVIVDESDKLLELAKRVASWFTVPKNVLRINSVRTSVNLKIGTLIEKIEPTTAVESTINSCITQVTMSFPGKPSMEVQTQSGELDPSSFLSTSTPL